MRILQILVAMNLLFALSFTSAHAAPFSYQYTDTVASSEIFGVGMGDSAVITVTLDNGSMTNQNQVWTSAHLVSVQFNFDFGAFITTFKSPFDGGIEFTTGSYVSDNTGALTEVSQWRDSTINNDFMTNSTPLTNYYWQLAFSSVFGFEDFDINLASERITDPTAWTEVQPVPVPKNHCRGTQETGWVIHENHCQNTY